MNLTDVFSGIKNFFIIFSSIYFYGKIINVHFNRKLCIFSTLFSLVSTTIICSIKTEFLSYTILTMTLFVMVFCRLIFKKFSSQPYCLPVLCVGSSYALFTLIILITSPITYLLVFFNLSDFAITSIILSMTGLLQILLLYLFFHTKRFKNGIKIANTFLSDIGIFTGTLLIVFSSIIFIETQRPVYLLLISFLFILGILIFLWWHKTVHVDYINKSYIQQIDILESKLQERDAELERLSKIIHKDNKLLAALELSTREILVDVSNEKAQSLLQELERFSKERSETLHAYEPGQITLPETGLFSVDTMIRYLHQRALKHKIDFQLSLEGEIADITNVISEEDLCTIIGDLGENAIIATRESEVKNIRLSLERKTDGYALYFYDSGEPFAAEVLENFGKQRCTTHAKTGGSGIGLVTTNELTAKYQGEFYITDEDILKPYTKCVVVILKQRH